MEEKALLDRFRSLNNSITILCRQFVVRNRSDLIEDVRPMLPEVQKFAMWFLETPDIGVEANEKEFMNSEVLSMLKDINEAIEKDDSILMYDALECGIAEYLRLFIPEEEQSDE